MTRISQIAAAMEHVLTTIARQAARTTGFIQRQRAFDGAQFVQTLVFGWLNNPQVATTALRGRAISLRFGLVATSLLPLLISGIIWHYTAILALPALAVLWQHNLRARLIALTTWVVISLIGGIGQPIMRSLCWCMCCWPHLLGPHESDHE